MPYLTLSPDDDVQKHLDAIGIDEKLHVTLLPGVYRQKIITRHNHLVIEGTSANDVVIVSSDHAGQRGSDGLKMITFATSTLCILGDDTILGNLTVRNDAGPVGQAIALSLYGDRTVVRHCRLMSHQDTVFVGPLPADLSIRYIGFLTSRMLETKALTHRFEDCDIHGAIDFIFGAGSVLFDRCHIIATNNGYIAAPATLKDVEFGLVFRQCLIESKAGEPYLARPWRNDGAVLFLDCHFRGCFHHDRYHDWGKSSFRIIEHPYVQSLLSKPLSKEEAARLLAFWGSFEAAPDEIRRN